MKTWEKAHRTDQWVSVVVACVRFRASFTVRELQRSSESEDYTEAIQLLLAPRYQPTIHRSSFPAALSLGNLCQAAKILIMSTVTMNISLTDDLKAFVDARIQARGYSSASEYVRDLLRRDEERASEERFKALLEDGMQSGSAGDWEDLRKEFLAESGVPLPSKRSA